MIDMKKATAAMAKLAVLKFFPADAAARAELVLMASEMASSNEQIDWLAARCSALWNEWEGPREMRAVFCSRFKPADGIEAFSNLPQFGDGIPSERPQLAAPPLKALPAGEPVTASPSIADTISDLCEMTDLNRVAAPKPRVRDIPVLREEQRTTPEMIAEAVRKHREAQGRTEVGL